MKKIWWFLQDEASGGEGGRGGGGAAVTPADARAFATNFVPDPKILEGMPDDQVLAYHGKLNGQLSEATKKALESHDWRKGIAGDNPDALATLNRFASPKALYESYDQFRTKLSKGELKVATPFPEKGTTEEQSTWRAQNGIPEAPDKYEIKLADGLKMEDSDNPFIESMLKAAHSQNVPPQAVNAMANWFFAERTQRTEAAAQQFEKDKQTTSDALHAEWGNDYRANLNRIDGMLDQTIPADNTELKGLIKRAIETNPDFARHYAALALQVNPAGSISGIDQGKQEGSISDEIKKIETFMRTDRAKYNKDETMQNRYRELLDGYQKVTGKAWGAAAA